jgi:hypothetical protein
MPRKALVFALSDGSLLNISYREEYQKSSDFQQRVRPHSFMRVGAYSVTIGAFDLAIAAPEDYRAPIIAGHPAFVSPESKYYEDSKRDRLRQLAKIEAALDSFGHPFAGLVRAEIETERSSYR